MRESSSRSELVHPNAITPIAVAQAIGPFLRLSRKPGARHKPFIAFFGPRRADVVSTRWVVYTAFVNSD